MCFATLTFGISFLVLMYFSYGFLMVPLVIYWVQIKDGFAEGKDLVVSVMSAMGEEQICALKDIGPK